MFAGHLFGSVGSSSLHLVWLSLPTEQQWGSHCVLANRFHRLLTFLWEKNRLKIAWANLCSVQIPKYQRLQRRLQNMRERSCLQHSWEPRSKPKLSKETAEMPTPLRRARQSRYRWAIHWEQTSTRRALSWLLPMGRWSKLPAIQKDLSPVLVLSYTLHLCLKGRVGFWWRIKRMQNDNV